MKITPLVASRFRSDGGVMFGIVPKPLWQRLLPADERNTIPQNLNTLLIELDDGRKGLLDLGCGNPAWFPEKARGINGLHREWQLQSGLAAAGVTPEDIQFVVLSHLHWDHAGAVGQTGPDGTTELVFANAVHFMHAVEYYDASTGNTILHKAYPEDVWAPLAGLDRHHRRLVDSDAEEVLPGIHLLRSGGHTNGHCTILLEAGEIEVAHPSAAALGTVRRAVYAADVCPTQHHLRMVFVAAYDLYPLETRRWKQSWLPRIAEDDTLLLFDHDPALFGARIKADAKQEFAVTDRLEATPDV